MGIKKQYQTIIVACAFTLLFVNTGFTSTSFSIYQSYIVDIPGVGDVGGSVVVTVRTFVSLICMFFTGVYFRRLNPRIGFFIATLFTALAFFLFGRAYSLAGLCVASAFAGIGYGFGGMVGIHLPDRQLVSRQSGLSLGHRYDGQRRGCYLHSDPGRLADRYVLPFARILC